MVHRSNLVHHRVASPPESGLACGGVGNRPSELLNLGPTGGAMDQKLLDEINDKVRAALAQGPIADVEKNLRVMLAGMFSRLDLVRRDEFDVQREVLARTRAKLVELERKLAALEAAAKAPDR